MLTGKVSLVIPAHNEADNIAGVVDASIASLRELADSFELVLVDDGSSDGTADVARAAAAAVSDTLRVVRHEAKSGYGISVRDGLMAATGDYVGFMDGDGQFDARDLALLAAHFDRADFVAGVRRHRADPFSRLVISGTFNILVRVVYGLPFRDVDCGMKLMRRSVLDSARPLQARSALLNTELFFKARRAGFRIVQVDVPHHPRVAGVRSGARLKPILRAVRELLLLRLRLRGFANPPPG